jgi:hypothetical protein
MKDAVRWYPGIVEDEDPDEVPPPLSWSDRLLKAIAFICLPASGLFHDMGRNSVAWMLLGLLGLAACLSALVPWLVSIRRRLRPPRSDRRDS